MGFLKKLKKKVKHPKLHDVLPVITTVLPIPPVPIAEIVHNIPHVAIPKPKEIKNTIIDNANATGNFIKKTSETVWDGLDMDPGKSKSTKNKDKDKEGNSGSNEINPIWYVGTAAVIAGILFM